MKNLPITWISCIAFSIFLITACADDNGLEDDRIFGALSGTIYYENYDGFHKIDARTGAKTSISSLENHYNWHISKDGSTIMEMTNGRSSGRPDEIKITLKDLQSGVVRNEFFYRPINGGSIFQSADLSPDKSLICIYPSFEEGFVILDATNGNLVAHVEMIDGEAVERYESFGWLPDNSLLIKWKNAIIRSPKPYTGGDLVKEFEVDTFGSFAVNTAGTKVAMNYQGHIAVMNTDGSDFTMVTASGSQESGSAFSPDGTKLLVGADFQRIGVPGSTPTSSTKMKVIPLDGNTYNLDADDQKIISVIPTGESAPESVNGLMLWVP